jgi:hypothetical protein
MRMRFAGFLLIVVCASETTHAQNRLSDIPEGFFGAQRGRVVTHGQAGFRLHYGRGLTPQGASVITTGITTLGPLVLGAPAAAMIAPPSAAPGLGAQAAPDCEPTDSLPPDTVLDALASQAAHDKHMAHLDNMLVRLKPVVEGYQQKFLPAEPAAPNVGTSDGNNNDNNKPLNPVGGGVVNPPADATQPNPATQPTASAPVCVPAQICIPAQIYVTPIQPPQTNQPTPTQPTPTQPAPTQPAPTQPAPTQPAPAGPAPAGPAPTPATPAQPLVPAELPAPGTTGAPAQPGGQKG